ncbi:MAG: DUF1579 family protein [Planctomycetota bacterium]|nr:DUF1579 family protein [Planctomycetota bacterium]
MTTRLTTLVLAAILVLAVAGSGFTEDKPAEKPQPMSEGEMWAKAAELATPSAVHKDVLAPMAGTWSATGKAITGMGEIPISGTAVQTLVMGGRFIHVAYEGPFMGGKFEGGGYIGYDNQSKTFQQAWVMTMATSMDVMTGTWDAKTKTITWRGSMKGPDGVTYAKRTTTCFKDADTMVSESFATGPDGKERKEMEMTYKRSKK